MLRIYFGKEERDVPEVSNEDDDGLPVLEQAAKGFPYASLRYDIQRRCVRKLFSSDHAVLAEGHNRWWRIASMFGTTMTRLTVNLAG